MCVEGIFQVLLEARCIAVDVGDEHIADEALPCHRSGEQTMLCQSGLVGLASEGGKAGIVKRGQVGQLLPEIVSDIIRRDFSHILALAPC